MSEQGLVSEQRSPKRKKGFSVNWRRDPTILARLPRVEEMVLSHIPNVHIAKALGVDEGTIRSDRKRIMELLVERFGADDITAKRAQRIAELQNVHKLAYLEFQRTSGSSLNKSQYLNVMIRCIAEISKIEGSQAPVKLEGADGGDAALVKFTINLGTGPQAELPEAATPVIEDAEYRTA